MRKVFSVLLAVAAFLWFVYAVVAIVDREFHFSPFTLAVAFFITGCAVAKWAVEEWDA